MISVVFYGRNDSYGYNLHKRVALSINNVAELLTDETDEILFVDYNTPDDFPTLPEAIEDTLTEAAKAKLRIIRVRPHLHEQFSSRTHLNALEPISRNVAIRRSNPKNRWILSSNTDMIFVPRADVSLTEICRDLPDGHYGIPRMEIPETLWEHFDRKDPVGVIKELSELAWDLHLNECVFGEPPHNFDAPGDFQLMLRDDLFRIDAFDEDMLLGWHLDSNIAKRLSILRGDASDLTEFIFGYHCDHTRQVTPMHKADSPSNSIKKYITDIFSPGLPAQARSWGLANDSLEEISLLGGDKEYVEILKTVLAPPQINLTSSYYRRDFSGINQHGSARHILPFLYDLFSSRRRDCKVLWVGKPSELLTLFSEAMSRNAFLELPSHVDPTAHTELLRTAYEQNDFYIFDFDWTTSNSWETFHDSDSMSLFHAFQEFCHWEYESQKQGNPPKLFIGINTVANRFESMFLNYIGASKTPFSTRVRHGYLHLERTEQIYSTRFCSQNWLRSLSIGDAGNLSNGTIQSVSGKAGHVVYGPYAQLRPGEYVVEASGKILKGRGSSGAFTLESVFVEVVSGETVLGVEPLIRSSRNRYVTRIQFNFNPDVLPIEDVLSGIQIRIFSNGEHVFTLENAVCGPLKSDAVDAK